jgi:hypothetical protein
MYRTLLVPLALSACSSSPSTMDASVDLAAPTDSSSATDLAGADLAGGPIHLTEDSCPANLNNGRCYFTERPDGSFY